MSTAVVVSVVAASSVWVYFDATKNKIGKLSGAKGMFNMSAGAWAVATLLLWIVTFPAYLIKRSSLMASAATTPVGTSGRGIKLTLLTFVAVLLVLAQLGTPNPAQSQKVSEVAAAQAVKTQSPREIEEGLLKVSEKIDYRKGMLEDYPKDTQLHFDGVVLQVANDTTVLMTIGTTDNIVWIEFNEKPRLLEGDVARIYGKYAGTSTYEAITGEQKKAPVLIADFLRIAQEQG